MQLELRNSEKMNGPVVAAFLRGVDPGAWLRGINAWGVALEDLEAYLVPGALRSGDLAGLFVVSRNGAMPEAALIRQPYVRRGERLYLPADARLWPAVTEEELDRHLLYDRQLFHPAIGLVGFAKSDRLHWVDLLSVPAPRNAQWDIARPAPAEPPALKEIRLEPPPGKDLASMLSGDLNAKSLDDLPGPADTGAVDGFMDKMKERFLKGLQDLPGGKSNSGAGNGGFADRFQSWVTRQLSALEEKRKSQIERLLDMFDKDPDRALEYSIPVGGQYEGRGVAPPSDTLGRHGTDFKLGALSGGRRTDRWGMDRRYIDRLRKEYRKRAEALLAEGDFRKAAYVYAHLLGDLHSAANVLMQGHYYREAAVIYREHLGRKLQAAECLVKGGLLPEAITIYEELQKFEEAGDLCRRLGREEDAIPFYEMETDRVLTVGNYLEAARIMTNKLDRREEAKALLLKGWRGSGQEEDCLKLYFDLIGNADETALPEAVRTVCDDETPRHKRSLFFNVLLEVNRQRPTEELTAVSREMAYEILSERIEQKDTADLKALRYFLPDDPLISPDINRFLSGQEHRKPAPTVWRKTRKPVKIGPARVIQLKSKVNWRTVMGHRNYFFAGGDQDGVFHLSRGNWRGHVAYYSHPQPKMVEGPYWFLPGAPAAGQLLLYGGAEGWDIDRRIFAGRHYRPGYSLNGLDWLPKTTLGVGANNHIAAIVAGRSELSLNHYAMDGRLVSSRNCQQKGQPLTPDWITSSVRECQPLFFRKGRFYGFFKKAAVTIREDGAISWRMLPHWPRQVVVSDSLSALRLAFGTPGGCLFYRHELNQLTKVGDFFARDLQAADMAFVPGAGLVVGGTNGAEVYDIGRNRSAPELAGRLMIDMPVRKVLRTNRRSECALFLEDGRIVIYDLRAVQEIGR